MNLFLLGCTGFVGKALIPKLLEADHKLTVVSRKAQNLEEPLKDGHKITFLKLDPTMAETWQNNELNLALSQSDGVINLAGEPIAEKRWTEDHCELIRDSRLKTTGNLVSTLSRMKKNPRLLINASAIGFYGNSLTTQFNENSSCSNDFLAQLCKDWEKLASQKPRRTRLVILRIGIVLGKSGGALGKMLPIFRAGFGGPIGNGQQWMSWIHINDLCNLIINSLKSNSYSGIFNAVSPQPIKMSQFSQALGDSLGRPSLLPVPGPILKLLLGDGAKVVLEGQYVESIRLKQIGFKFQYPSLEEALDAATS